MRRKIGFLCMGTGLLLLLAAVGLLIYNNWDNYRAGKSAAGIYSELESIISGNAAGGTDAGTAGSDTGNSSGGGTEQDGNDTGDGTENSGGNGTGTGIGNGNGSETGAGNETADSETGSGTEMATAEIDGSAYIGILTIPSLGLELPIQSEWSYAGLKIAPGRYSGSVWTDDLVICGHNYTRHFGNLKYLEQGDPLYFTDVNGNVFAYEVEEVVILQPTDVEEMMSRETGEWDLTLFTCTIGGQTRVTVRCSRTN
ncbi:MAG: sortase [Lachnospiraceae bacterium]|nr:sortase [Lachnospiraceae bacterium]